MKMNILLVGGRDMAATLSRSLIAQKHQVTAINQNEKDCVYLAGIKGLHVIHGDGSKPFILEEADAAQMDIAIALTPKDDDNLVICELCKKRFGVPKTVSVIRNGENTAFFRKMGIDSVVCATNTISGIIQQLAFMNDMATLTPVGDGRLSIAEVKVADMAPSVGKKLWELALPKDVIVGCILRQEQTIIPRGDTCILAGDTLVLLCAAHQELEAVRALCG